MFIVSLSNDDGGASKISAFLIPMILLAILVVDRKVRINKHKAHKANLDNKDYLDSQDYVLEVPYVLHKDHPTVNFSTFMENWGCFGPILLSANMFLVFLIVRSFYHIKTLIFYSRYN